MATDNNFRAIKLEQAKQDLESQLEQAIRAFEQRTEGPVAVNMDLDDDAGENEQIDAELRSHIRNLVDAFHARDVVQQTGVRAHHITAFDSDADGTVAVNVKYEYPL